MFRINSGARQRCIMSPWLFNVYMDAVMKEVKVGMRRRGVKFQEGRELEIAWPLVCRRLGFVW